MNMEIVKLSSRGQLVLPLSIRKRFGIGKGEKLVLVEKDGTVVLRPLKQIKADLEDELYLMLKAEKGWERIEKGNVKKMSRKEFLKELSAW
jgi:AbrB family looped-hinge helix DNA binding protein